MAYQGIGTGTTPNDNSGDSLLVGAVKINSNFQELYNALGDGITLSFTEKAQDAFGAAINSGIQTGITVTYDDANNRINFNNTGGFPAGTAMLFQQTTAPTGWTKQTTHDDKALRVVSGSVGSGGNLTFSSAFTSRSITGNVGDTTLTINQIPSHAHEVVQGTVPLPLYNTFTRFSAISLQGYAASSAVPVFNFTWPTGTSNTGGGEAHTHSLEGVAVDFAVQYVDVIIATKD